MKSTPAAVPQDLARPPKYQVNRSLLIWSLIILIAAGAGSYGLRQLFAKRNASMLLVEAEKADAADDLRRAERFYAQYLQLTKGMSKDPVTETLRAETLYKLGQVLARSDTKSANVPRIARIYEEALRLKPELDSVRRELIPRLILMRRFNDALEHIAYLEKGELSDADAAELAFRAGRCHELKDDRTKAQLRYRDSISRMPNQLSAYIGLARIWATEKSGVEFVVGADDQWPEFVELRKGKVLPTHAAIEVLLDHMVQSHPGPEAEATRASALLGLRLTSESPSIGPDAAAAKTAAVLAEADTDSDGVLAEFECWHAIVPAMADADDDRRITPKELTQRFIEGDRGARWREGEKALARLSQSASPVSATALSHLLYNLIAARLEDSTSATALPAEERQAILNEAQQLTKQAIEKNATDPRIQFLVAEIELQSTQTASSNEQKQQHYDNAEAALRKGLELNATFVGNRESDGWSTPFETPNSAVTELQMQYMLGHVLISSAELRSEPGTIELPEVREIATKLRQSGADARLPLLLEFRLAMLLPDSNRAAKLEAAKILSREVGNPDTLSRDAAAMLGAAYVQFGDVGAALEVYRRQLKAEPLWVVGRVALAEVLSALGRTDEAISQYESVLGFPGVADRLAVVLMVQQSQRPIETRDLSRAKAVVELASALSGDANRSLVLQSEMSGLEALTLSQLAQTRTDPKDEDGPKLEALAQKMRREAEDRLRTAVREQPKVVSLWTALISQLLRREELPLEERIEKASEVLDEAKATVGPHSELAIAELTVAEQKKQQAELAVAERLVGELKSFTDDGKTRLVLMLSQILRLYEKAAEARALLAEYAQQVPKDLDFQRTLSQVLLVDFHPQDPVWESQWSDCLERIEAFEGTTQGDVLLAQTQRLIAEASSEAKPKLSDGERTRKLRQARESLAIVRKARPYLAAVPRAMGVLEEEVGRLSSTPANLEAAAAAYREARLLGDRSKLVVTRLVAILMEQHHLDLKRLGLSGEGNRDSRLGSRFLDEANRLLSVAAAEQANVVSGDLARLAWSVADRRGDFDGAADIGGQIAAATGTLRDRFKAAHYSFIHGQQTKDIRDTFDAYARTEEPKDAQAWVPLLLFDSRANQWDKVEETIRDVEKNYLTEKTAKNAVALAQFWDSLSLSVPENPQYRVEAANHYDVVERDYPDDNLAQLLVANFLLRVKSFDRAGKILNRLLEPGRDLPEGLRETVQFQLVSLQNPTDKYQDMRAAIAKLESFQASGGGLTPANLRYQLQVLSRSTNPEFFPKLAAIYANLQTVTKGQLTDDERLKFAQVLNSLNRWDEAQVQFNKCPANSPLYIRTRVEYCLAMLQRAAEIPELLDVVQRELADVEKAERTSWRVASVKARFLAARDQKAEAVAKLSALATARLEDRSERRFLQLLQQEPPRELFEEWLAGAAATEKTAIVKLVNKIGPLLNKGNLDDAAKEMADSPLAPSLDQFVVRKSLELALLVATWDTAAAEALMNQCLVANDKPDSPRELARLYAKASRIKEAMDTCERYWDRITPPGVAYIMSLLVRAEGEVPMARLREWRDRLVADAATLPIAEQGLLYLHLGNFDNESGSFEEAIKEYAKANESTGRRFDSLNNYAFLSARMKVNLAEATEAIESAIQIVGGRPELMDTKATVLMAQGQLKEAATILEDLSKARADGSILFRLAECYHRQKNPELAAAYLKRAFKNGLELRQLHPLDQVVLKELQSINP